MNENRKRLQKIIKYGALTVWAILIVLVVVNRNKITADLIVNYTPSNLFLAAVVMLLLFTTTRRIRIAQIASAPYLIIFCSVLLF